jgi:5'-deoxynucleotidase YfbR-like HD superfamily hydrolase
LIWRNLFREFSEEKSKEAKVVRDADILSGMLLEKEALITEVRRLKMADDFPE